MNHLVELGTLLLIYLLAMVILTCWKKDTSIGNFTWGGGVLLVTLYTFFRLSSFMMQQILATTCIILWAGRLIAYIYIRYTGNDPRFVTWKHTGIKALIINIVWIFGQLLMIAIMSYPLMLINMFNFPHPVSLFDIVGLLIWIGGYCCEAMSDQQLFNFTRNPLNKGKILQSGLWHYSRHPNYFGESVMWIGIYCMALSTPLGFTACIAPLTIIFLLRFVTGVPLLERAMKDNPEYQEYQRKTNVFVPWVAKG